MTNFLEDNLPVVACRHDALAMPSLAFGAVPCSGNWRRCWKYAAARYIAKDSKGVVDVTLVEASNAITPVSSPTCIWEASETTGLLQLLRSCRKTGRQCCVWVGHIRWLSNKIVNLGHGGQVSCDRPVLSPGISLKYDSLPGYSPEMQHRMPHAWPREPSPARVITFWRCEKAEPL